MATTCDAHQSCTVSRSDEDALALARRTDAADRCTAVVPHRRPAHELCRAPMSATSDRDAPMARMMRRLHLRLG